MYNDQLTRLLGTGKVSATIFQCWLHFGSEVRHVFCPMIYFVKKRVILSEFYTFQTGFSFDLYHIFQGTIIICVNISAGSSLTAHNFPNQQIWKWICKTNQITKWYKTPAVQQSDLSLTIRKTFFMIEIVKWFNHY